MNTNIDDVRRRIKNKKTYTSSTVKKDSLIHNDLEYDRVMKFLNRFVLRLMAAIVLFLGVAIGIRENKGFKAFVYDKVYVDFNFQDFNSKYLSRFGSILPFDSFVKDKTKLVTSEINFTNVQDYLDGYLVPAAEGTAVQSIEEGSVLLIAEKENYGKVVVVQQANGINVWYGNLNNVQVSMYSVINKGQVIGDVAGDQAFFAFLKDNKFISYQDYLANAQN